MDKEQLGARVTYASTVDDVLAAVGGADGALGSGAATALSLSLGIECLALHLALTRRRSATPESEAWLAEVAAAVPAWREGCRRCFQEDQVHFAEVIKARRARSETPAGERADLAARELKHLARANGVLLSLLDVAGALASTADLMIRQHGARVGEGESATALALATAAEHALAAMLASNVGSAADRLEALGVALPAVDAVRTVVPSLPAGPGKERLVSALRRHPA